MKKRDNTLRTFPKFLAIMLVIGPVIGINLWQGIPTAEAADHYNLEEGIPTQLEDALPIAYRGRELQGLFRYELTDKDTDRYVLEPRLELGLLRNLEAEIAVPFLFGSAPETGSGDIELGALYNFNQETIYLPAFALSGRLEIPTGKDSEGVDTTLKFIASKTLGKSSVLHRLHLNLAWKHNFDSRKRERDDLYKLIVGYSRRLGPETIVVIDYVRQQELEENKEANIVELGIRYQLTPFTVIAIGGGAGFAEESPDILATFGFQHTLHYLYW